MRVQAVSLVRTAVPATALGVLVAAVPYSTAVFGRSAQDSGPWWPVLLPLAVAVLVVTGLTAACFALANLLSGRVRAAAAPENLRVP